MKQIKLFLTIKFLILFVSSVYSDNKSDWWNGFNNFTDHVPVGTVRSLVNSTINGNEYWQRSSSFNSQSITTSHNETFNEILQPETVLVAGKNRPTKIVRKVKRTFKNKTIKQNSSPEEIINDRKEDLRKPSVTLDNNLPYIEPKLLPGIHSNHFSENLEFTTVNSFKNNDFENIRYKVNWDDETEGSTAISSSPVMKTKMGNQENIYEKYASVMPLPPPSTISSLQTTTLPSTNAYKNENNKHHSVVSPSSSSNNYYNFNSKIFHNLPASKSFTSIENKNQRNKQKINRNNLNNPADFKFKDEKFDKNPDDKHLSLIKTVDFTSKINHDINPANSLLAHLLKNNPLAIPLSKKTYKITKKPADKESFTPTPVITKRIQTAPSPMIKLSNQIKKQNSVTSNKLYSTFTTPMSKDYDLSNKAQIKVNPSNQEYVWGKRMQKSFNLIDNSKTNVIENNNKNFNKKEWSGLDEQKSFNNEREINTETEEESIENDQEDNLSDEVELVNNDDLNNEFEKNVAEISNEELAKNELENTEKNKISIPVKNTPSPVKQLPIQIINWKQAISHRKRVKELPNENYKEFNGGRLIIADLAENNENNIKQQKTVERQNLKPTAKTTKQPTYTSSKSTTKTSQTPKITTTKPFLQNDLTNTKSTTKKTTTSNYFNTLAPKLTTRSPLNTFISTQKNEPYVAPKTKSAQLFQEYEDDKAPFSEEIDDNLVKKQIDFKSSPKKENRVKYSKNQEFKKKSLNLVEEKSYPIENTEATEPTRPIPITSFKCINQPGPGYYGDIETGCEVFHICQDSNRKDSFFCPPGTAFNQNLLVCDWKNNVSCGSKTNLNFENGSNDLNNGRNNYEIEDILEDLRKK